MDTINIFKNIVFELRDWYVKERGITNEVFNENNDFNILKLIKLHFFVVAINSEKEDCLLEKSNFWAMPYGPVETDVYGQIRNDKNFSEFNLSNNNVHFVISSSPPQISAEFKLAIKNSIDLLKKTEPNLVFADAGTLVDLTHTWNCWKRNYNLARVKGKYSEPIPKEQIKNDVKIINLNFVQ